MPPPLYARGGGRASGFGGARATTAISTLESLSELDPAIILDDHDHDDYVLTDDDDCAPVAAHGGSIVNGNGNDIPYYLNSTPANTLNSPSYRSPLEEARERRSRARRLLRHDQSLRMQSYNGLMRPFDIDQVTRRVISSLVSTDPYLDDFYFHSYGERAGNPEPISISSGAGKLLRPLLERGRNHNIREGMTLQDQIERMVDKARHNPRQNHLKMDGALGNIAFNSAKNPRQTLDMSLRGNQAAEILALDSISPTDTASSVNINTTTTTTTSTTSIAPNNTTLMTTGEMHLACLAAAERAFDLVIDVELILRRFNNSKEPSDGSESGQPTPTTFAPPSPIEVEESRQRLLDYLTSYSKTITHDSNSKSVANVVAVMSSCKGLQLFPRICAVLQEPATSELQVVCKLLSSAQKLHVIRNASLPALFSAPALFPGIQEERPTRLAVLRYAEAVDAFVEHVVPALVRFVCAANWETLEVCFRTLIENNDLPTVCASRAGLLLVTMLVSRAEVLRRSASAPTWRSLFAQIMARLEGSLAAFFPIASLPSLQSHAHEATLTDDLAAWQCLAVLAVSASPEQHASMVVETRDRIVAIVTAGRAPHADAKARRSLDNVNLFLSALGLIN